MVGQESELVCSVTEVVLLWSLCGTHRMHRDGPQCHCQQRLGVLELKVTLLPLPFAALRKSLVWLFLCQDVCAWLSECSPTMTQPQHCLAPVCTPCCCRISSPGQAQLWWDGMFHSTDLLKMCVSGTGG